MGREKILIAEDESRVAQALSRALSLPEGGGYLVETRESGEEALARLSETHFDLLITDLRMPGMSGMELLGKCQKISPDTARILITAFGSPQVEETAYELAVDAYLTKPFSIRDLVQTVQRTLKAKTRVSAPQPPTTFSEEGLRAIRERMATLCLDAGAHGTLLFDESGKLLAESGQRGDFDTGAFLGLLGNAMAATQAVSNVLGDQRSIDLHFYEGKQYDIYTAHVSNQVFLSLLLNKQGNNSRIGMVWLYLRRAITDLRNLLANASDGSSVNEDDSAARKALEEALASADAISVPKEPIHSPSAEDRGAVITYDQAKHLGLVDFDTPDRNQGK